MASQDHPKYWWVNHKQTYRQEVSGGYLWSPMTNANGRRNHFYDNMLLVKAGDLVFSFADACIKAVGKVLGEAVLAPKPDAFGCIGDNWGSEGWQVPVAFVLLDHPIRLKHHLTPDLVSSRSAKYAPFQSNGHANQGAYLSAVSAPMFHALQGILGAQWRQLNAALMLVSIKETTTEDLCQSILSQKNIGTTQSTQLIQARRGQGVFRRNVTRYESCCRITGVDDPAFLIASHIKPWRQSTNEERLSGANGLLLSPHIDRLFDQGYLSFSETGQLLLSEQCPATVLKAWGIDPNINVGFFCADQAVFLAFHRAFVFKIKDE